MSIGKGIKSSFNKMYNVQLSLHVRYFIFAIIIIGSIGVWLPFLLAELLGKTVELNSIPINLTTFYVSIYFAGCVEFILKKIDSQDQSNVKTHAFNMVMLIVLAITLIISTIWMSISEHILGSIILASIGCVIALRLWWVNNHDNPNFNEVVRSQGNKIHGNTW
jgi:magnesium-transporting ATPase (P-type)